jgi:anti-anti-sigma regulatory factor
MLRITRTTLDRSTPMLRLEGQVTGQWVEELRRTCLETLAERGLDHPALVLDLAGVSFLDPEGIGLFRELTLRHVRVTHQSPFIAEQLKGVVNVEP